MSLERFYMKTRNLKYSNDTADSMGIKRIYNYTSDIDFVDDSGYKKWIDGLYRQDEGEAVIVESAMKVVNGIPLFVASCVVFYSVEHCNVYFLKNIGDFRMYNGFSHLLN